MGELSKREKQVLRLVACGLANAEIATALEIAEKTVKCHVAHVYKKIGGNNRMRATIFALKSELVTLDELGISP